MRTIRKPRPLRNVVSVLACALVLVPAALWANAAQEKLATAYLKANASVDPAALQGMFHPDELVQLRARVLKALEAENAQNGSAIRTRRSSVMLCFSSSGTLKSTRINTALFATSTSEIVFLGMEPGFRRVFVKGFRPW